MFSGKNTNVVPHLQTSYWIRDNFITCMFSDHPVNAADDTAVEPPEEDNEDEASDPPSDDGKENIAPDSCDECFDAYC